MIPSSNPSLDTNSLSHQLWTGEATDPPIASPFLLAFEISIEKRPRVYECYWAHFAAENPLERIVGVPSLWPRLGGVLQQHGLGVLRPSGGANAVAGCFWGVISYMPVSGPRGQSVEGLPDYFRIAEYSSRIPRSAGHRGVMCLHSYRRQTMGSRLAARFAG